MITTVNDYNIDTFLDQDLCTLVLARSNCSRCITYLAEVDRLIASDALGSTAVGVVMLDQPGVSQFKRNNLWLIHAQFLPYTVLFRNGQRIDGFSASRGHALLDHNRRTAPATLELVTMY
jgi:hypothetical protein